MTHRVAAHVNALSDDAARAQLHRCCACDRWVTRMLALRPFPDDANLFDAAAREWWRLTPTDWKHTFAAHPRIGERPGARHAATRTWSEREQAGAAKASDSTRAALAAGNRAYEDRFGHVFLICATGLGAEAMLEALERRLANTPDAELRVAAGEQAKITRLRLEKLVHQ